MSLKGRGPRSACATQFAKVVGKVESRARRGQAAEVKATTSETAERIKADEGAADCSHFIGAVLL